MVDHCKCRAVDFLLSKGLIVTGENQIIFNVILFIVVLVLFCCFFDVKKKKRNSEVGNWQKVSTDGPIFL